MHSRFVLSTRAILASLILLVGPVGPSQAAKLWQLLEAAQKDCPRIEQGLRTAGVELRATEANAEGECAAIITQLYMNSLMDREQQQILQTAIKDQRTVLEVVQSGVESGRGSGADVFIAEIELKRLQLQEAKHVTARRHSRLIFDAVLSADPAQFIAPVIPAEAWPEHETAALNALAPSETGSQEKQQRLMHAWADFEGVQRRRNLLQPMTALSQDLASTAMQWFEIGQISITQLSELLNNAVQQNLALAEAENNLLAARLRVLAILGRTGSID